MKTRPFITDEDVGIWVEREPALHVYYDYEPITDAEGTINPGLNALSKRQEWEACKYFITFADVVVFSIWFLVTSLSQHVLSHPMHVKLGPIFLSLHHGYL